MIVPGRFRGEHTIFMSPEWFPGAGAQFDARTYIRQLAESNVTAVEFYIKDHLGMAYYDTKVGHKSSHMRGDYLADLCAAAKEYNIMLLAYFSIGWDNWACQANPHWKMRNIHGGDVVAGPWTYLCYNTPYREFMLAQLYEIAQYDGVGAFWLDILRFPQKGLQACFCDGCRAKFRASGEADLPTNLDYRDPRFRRFQHFQQRCLTSFLKDVRKVTGAIPVTFNGVGFLTPKEWNDLCDWHNVESHGPEYFDQSYKGRYLAALQKPWEFLTPGTHTNWASWTTKPADALKLEQALAMSQCGICTIGANPAVNGDLHQERATLLYERRNMAAVMGFVKAREEWIVHTRRVANVAILQTIGTDTAMFGGHPNAGIDQDVYRTMRRNEPLQDYPREVILEAMGMHGALLPTDTQYEIMNEYCLHRLAEFDTVILPDQRHLSDVVTQALRDFVTGGGNLIATYQTSLLDEDGRQLANFALADVLGVDLIDLSHFAIHFLDLIDGPIAQGPLDAIVRIAQGAVKVEPRAEVEVLAWLRNPDFETYQIADLVGPEVRMPPLYPAVTAHQYGRGRAYFVCLPLGRELYASKSHVARRVLQNLIALTSPSVVHTSNPKRIEVNVVRQADPGRALVHLVNVYSDKLEELCEWDVLHNITVRLKRTFLETARGGQWRHVYLAPGRRPVTLGEADGWVEVTIPRLELHEIIVFE